MGVKKMYVLPGGFLNVDRSIMLTAEGMGVKVKAPVLSVLLIHEAGPILVDCGLNPDGLTDPEGTWGPRAKVIQPEMTAADDIRDRLKQINLNVSDVKMVILTHLHWDHTGGLRYFNHCPILVQKVEYRFAFHPDSNVSAQYMPNHFQFPLSYQLVEGDQIVLPGISVMKTPGHTPGHQSVYVKLNSGAAFILAGDAIPVMENVTRKIPASNVWNAQQTMENIYRLEHLSTLLHAEIIPFHDITVWKEMKKIPEFYD
ncbi:MAG: N-acyl homoserine lactonase family protein [Thermodesulfobacteriota bacterium]|jgi:N-acyl homoserine lactone hydrolase